MSSTCEGVPTFPTGGTFTVWDYLVFGAVLAISAAIGLYYGCSGGKQKTTKEFLLADKSMSAIPVSVSIFASFFTASTLLGTPVEIYTQGTLFWMNVWGGMLIPVLGAFIFGPFFHRLKIISAFEYLEVRYKSRAVRVFGCLIYIVKLTIAMGIAMLGPAVALTEVTRIPVWATIVTTGVVCVFYTTLGGMKAVIWTDVFQCTIMLAGVLAPIIQGCIETGGIGNIWKLAEEGGRIEFFDFNLDPTVRHTTWTVFFGSVFNWLPYYSVEQQMIQRFASAKSKKQATIAVLLNAPGILITSTVISLLGIVMYGYYAPMKCDPLKSGRVSNPNQLAPRFVMDIFHFAPGIPGLYVGSIFAGALSTVSSILNALGTVAWEDIFKVSRSAREASDKTATLATKMLGVAFAACGMGLAFVFSYVGGTIIQMSIAFNGVAVAPITGIFMLGFFFPWANWIGALAGGVLGLAFPVWLGIGAYLGKPAALKPIYDSLECCDTTPDNFTSTSFYSTTDLYTTPTTAVPEVSGFGKLYTLSYLYYTMVGMFTTIVVGLLVSFLTGYTKPKEVNPKHLISFFDTFCCCFPESCRSKCRCGIDFNQDNDEDSISKAKLEFPAQSLTLLYSEKNIVTSDPEKMDVLMNNNQKPSPYDENYESTV